MERGESSSRKTDLAWTFCLQISLIDELQELQDTAVSIRTAGRRWWYLMMMN